MPYQHILVDDPRPRVRRITLNRPDELNAVNDPLHVGLARVWEALNEDATARAAVITGAGRAFSAGGMLSAAGSEHAELPLASTLNPSHGHGGVPPRPCHLGSPYERRNAPRIR